MTVDQAFPEARRGRAEPKRTDVGGKLRGDGKQQEEPPPADEDGQATEATATTEEGKAEEGTKAEGEDKAQPTATAPADGDDDTAKGPEAPAEGEAGQEAAQGEVELTEDERDVIADVTAAISGGGKPNVIRDDFRGGIATMSPEGRAIVEGILTKAGGKPKAKSTDAVRLL